MSGFVLRPRHLLLVVLATVAPATVLPVADAGSRARSQAPAERIDRGVPYGRAADERGREVVLRMDVHRPAGARRDAPAIVWIHGGGFTKGHRGLMRPYAQAFARRGWLAVSIDYRLASAADLAAAGRTAPLRDAQHDAQAAVRYLRRHARELDIDPRRIHVGGTSAGAMTALSVALHPDDPGRSGNGGVSSRVRAAVAVAGFAPSAPIGADAPPLLLLHGTDDRILPFARAQETCRRAHAGGARCDLVAFPGAGHRLIWERTDELAARAARWLGRLP